MPSVAPNYRVKRILSSNVHLPTKKDTSRKKTRVQFDDHVRVIQSEASETDPMPLGAIDNDGELDFTLYIGDDGEIDYTIEIDDIDTKKEQSNATAAEGCASQDVNSDKKSTYNITPPLSIDACSRTESPSLLVTPPASPKRIHTVSKYGEEEEATICEWPSNLAVDIAITAASSEDSLVPLLDYCSD